MGALCAEDRLAGASILSDDAGSSASATTRCVGFDAERLVYKLDPANDGSAALSKSCADDLVVRSSAKAFKLAPAGTRSRTESAVRPHLQTLNRIRHPRQALNASTPNKGELLRVLERPEIPLNIERIRKRHSRRRHQAQSSGGTVSENGRIARDVMLGLAKTCAKLEISFFDYLGDRLEIPGTANPAPRTLVAPNPT